MKSPASAPLLAVVIALASPSALVAQRGAGQPPPAAVAPRIKVCSLLPKEEVKQHLPWRPLLDQFPIEEEAIGASGSSCNYPSVTLQVLPFSQGMIDAAREKGGLEKISGVGDEAYFHNNADRYAELYVKVGNRMLTVQANAEKETMESAKSGAVSLARALVAKLR
jgi:hypothetical protein